jgi:hypothetical protein
MDTSGQLWADLAALHCDIARGEARSAGLEAKFEEFGDSQVAQALANLRENLRQCYERRDSIRKELGLGVHL